MSRRIDIELTSSRDDGSWTWRAAGAREPRGTLEAALVPNGAQVGDVLRAEIEGYLEGLSVVGVVPPRAPRPEPERLELRSVAADGPLVTSTLTRPRTGERGSRRRGERGDQADGGVRRRSERERDRSEPERRGVRGDRRGRERQEGRQGRERQEGRQGRERQEGRHERATRPAPPPVETRPKPKRLRARKTHRNALLEAVSAEQRPIAEQLLQGGLPSVRQAIDKQNEALRAEGKPEVKPDQLLRAAEELRPRAAAAVWRDRAEAAVASIDELDLRDLRSVVNAAGDAGRDEEARALAAQLREALTDRVEKEHAAWLAEIADTLRAGRVVRGLRLSSRPPKAGAPIPGDLSNELVEATATALTDETSQERWAAVLDALAFSPIRRRVVPRSLPTKLSPELRATVARLGSRLPDIAHIFAIEPDESAGQTARPAARRRSGTKGDSGRSKGDANRSTSPRDGRPERKRPAIESDGRRKKPPSEQDGRREDPPSEAAASEAAASEGKGRREDPPSEAAASEAAASEGKGAASEVEGR